MNEKFPNELLRSIIGIEKVLLSSFKPESFPKYEILENKDKNKYKIRLLLAGYKEEDIKIIETNNYLLISHDKKEVIDSEDEFQFLTEKTISTRSFNFKMALYNHQVKSASFSNGILEIIIEENPSKAERVIQIN